MSDGIYIYLHEKHPFRSQTPIVIRLKDGDFEVKWRDFFLMKQERIVNAKELRSFLDQLNDSFKGVWVSYEYLDAWDLTMEDVFENWVRI